MRLIHIEANKTVVVKKIIGDKDVHERLEALGIRPGKKIAKISSHFWKGPVTAIVGKTKIAIGHGMAKRIVVESDEK